MFNFPRLYINTKSHLLTEAEKTLSLISVAGLMLSIFSRKYDG